VVLDRNSYVIQRGFVPFLGERSEYSAVCVLWGAASVSRKTQGNEGPKGKKKRKLDFRSRGGGESRPTMTACPATYDHDGSEGGRVTRKKDV